MAESKATKKRLSINLSFLTLTDPRKLTTAQKSPQKFKEDPNGVVGLGILAALDNNHHHKNHQDPIFITCNRASPKITPNPVPILTNKRRLSRVIDGSSCSGEKHLGVESCEEYTCVISRVGENMVKKREYFEADFLRNSDAVVLDGGEVEIADFLSSCFMCKKMLHGLDIFMYRGEKAFCSADCRYRQMSIDEKKEKCRSGVRKTIDHSASPTLQFFAGVAAA